VLQVCSRTMIDKHRVGGTRPAIAGTSPQGTVPFRRLAGVMKAPERLRGLRQRTADAGRPPVQRVHRWVRVVYRWVRRVCRWVRDRTTRSPEATGGRHAPRLAKVRFALPAVLLTAGALLWTLYACLWDLAPRTELRAPDGGRYLGVDRLELIKTTITTCGFIGAVLAGLYAYRKQKIAESEAHRTDADQFAQRYTTAAEQLGHDQAAVRLAGVYAMARLADDWTEQRQTCIDVLCAYLRMPYTPDPESPHHRHGEKQVRLTIITTIRNHLTNPGIPPNWRGHEFDFTGATFDGGDFSSAVFSGSKIRFNHAVFSGGEIHFSNTVFAGHAVDFHRARFTGSTVIFNNMAFSCDAIQFYETEFSGGTVRFQNTKFYGGTIQFHDAKFSGGTVQFQNTEFSGGTIELSRSEFTGGTVQFQNTTHSGGTIQFHDAKFSGGTVQFQNTTYSGGIIQFIRSDFMGGTIRFRSTNSSGGTIQFDTPNISGTKFTLGPFQELIENLRKPSNQPSE
jgi:uncharacterized protein YjbI with pentapeptide repeats